MSVYVKTWNHKLPSDFEKRVVSSILKREGVFGTIVPDHESPYYPQRSDTKIMRSDVIASIICIGEMMEKLNFSDQELQEMALFVANGCFMEEQNKHINKLFKALTKIEVLETKEEKIAMMYRSIPPLSALETLTNSTMSFIAQYAKIKGLNSTFGNTSYSSFEVLKEAAQKIKYKQSKKSLAGGANGSGLYSALNYIGFEASNEIWKESLCCAYVLLDENQEESKIEIASFKNDKRVPSLIQKRNSGNWKQFFSTNVAYDYVVYSGGFTEKEFNDNRLEVSQLCQNYFSFNDEYGNTGAAAMILSLIHGSKMIEEYGYKNVVLLDRDPYGRETFIQLINAAS